MFEHPDDSNGDVDARLFLPIVVGAHLMAELEDRAIGVSLCRQIAERATTLQPVVCTDLWYLNAPDLQDRPMIALGRPGLNAAAAYLANQLPTVFVVEASYQVQMDPELIDLRVCLWGANAAANGSAAEVFINRYLDDFLEAAEAGIGCGG